MQSIADRWWIYQKERFPIFKNGLLIAVFSFSAVSHSLLLRARSVNPMVLERADSLWQVDGFSLLPTIGSALLGFMVVFLFFFQLRVADEFKDFEEDAQHRPYRPVPRGVIRLKELEMAAIASAVMQLGLSLAIHLLMVIPLLLIWFYMALMAQEFFAPNWLKSHPLFYMLSHMVVMPLIGLYVTACDWLRVGVFPPRGILWFLSVSFFAGLVLEIGRKIRAPKDEEPGVETYTARWGAQKAIMAWLGSIWLTTLATLLAAMYIQFTVFIALLLIGLLTLSVLVAWRFITHPVRAWATRFELLAGVWMLTVYPSLGIIPLLLHSM